MSIVENIATEVGDVLLIKADVPTIGLVMLSSFTDSILNESGDKLFYKEFRYSTDGINFSPWVELTDQNLSLVQVTSTDTFFIEYKYKRIGSDSSTPHLEFNSVEVTGEFDLQSCGQAYSNSIFSQFIDCHSMCVLGWMINVLEKLYKRGILPKYIDRGETSNTQGDDSDFLEFWKSITQFFAYIVCYARSWELSSIATNRDILSEYLEQYTILLCGSESTSELQYIMSHYYSEVRDRGTYEIIKTKGDGKEIDGEWHRLFCSLRECSDWYFSLTDNYRVGWVGDNSSPLYRGLTYSRDLNKLVDISVDDYILVSGTLSIVTSDMDNQGETIETLSITSSVNETGVGIQSSQTTTEKLIKISSHVNYEVTALVKVEEDTEFTFGVSCFDNNGNILTGVLTSIDSINPIVTQHFIEDTVLPTDTHYYKIRGILLSIEDYREDSSGIYQSLKMCSEDICYIYPYLVCKSVVGGGMKVYGLGVRPLNTPYSTGFEQGSKFIKMLVGNNGKCSNIEAEYKMRNLLLPYNTTYRVTYTTLPEETTLGSCNGIFQEIPTPPSVLLNSVYSEKKFLVRASAGTILLYEVSSGTLVLSQDNIDNETIYVVELQSVFIFIDGSWRFKRK